MKQNKMMHLETTGNWSIAAGDEGLTRKMSWMKDLGSGR
jgi:hypothetical protein